jgi:hypothetical protein
MHVRHELRDGIEYQFIPIYANQAPWKKVYAMLATPTPTTPAPARATASATPPTAAPVVAYPPAAPAPSATQYSGIILNKNGAFKFAKNYGFSEAQLNFRAASAGGPTNFSKAWWDVAEKYGKSAIQSTEITYLIVHLCEYIDLDKTEAFQFAERYGFTTVQLNAGAPHSNFSKAWDDASKRDALLFINGPRLRTFIDHLHQYIPGVPRK